MTIFYFDTWDDESHHADEFGSDYSDIAEAREDAIAIVKQMMSEADLSRGSRVTSVSMRAENSEVCYMVTLTLTARDPASPV